MGLGSILFLVVAIISLIAFIYLVVLTAKSWGVLHTLLLCCLFIECWVFLFMTAGVQDVRVPATKAAFEQAKKADAAELRTKELEWGDFSFGQEANDAVIPLQGRIKRLTADRGRVWREMLLLTEDANQYTLGVPAPDVVDDGLGNAQAPAAAPSSESLPKGLVVYAFGEQATDDGQLLPKSYLGEFKVASSQAGQVVLTPTRDLFPSQAQRISDGLASSWSLYELLPLDNHQAFAAPGSTPSSEELFGNIEEASLQELFADIEDDTLRQKVIDTYLNDGKVADASTPEENLWLQIELNQKLTRDVDSKDSADATERGYFDSVGRSIDTRLKLKNEGDENSAAAGEVTLDPEATRGQLIVVKDSPGTRALTEGDSAVASVVRRSNVRTLNDYEKSFNNIFIRDREVDEELEIVARDSAAIETAKRNAEEMIVARQAEKQALSSDLANMQKELDVLSALAKTEETKLVALRSKLSELYRDVQTKHAQQAAAYQSSAAEIN